MNSCVVAADLGGTKIRSGVFVDGEAHFVSDRPTDSQSGRAGVIAALVAAIAHCREKAGERGWQPQAVGLSCAGVIDPQQGTVVDATEAIPGWKGTELARLLGEQLCLPVAVENDVKAALLGELSRSPAHRDGTTVMLTLGTGLGGAISIDGKILPGTDNMAGHFGRMPLPCPWQSGKTFVLENLVSGTGLATIANRLAGVHRFADGREVLSALRRGEAVGYAARARFCEFLMIALQIIYWSLNPDRVLIGGGLVSAREDWWLTFEERQAAAGLPLAVEPAQLGNDAGIHGAALLARQKIGEA